MHGSIQAIFWLTSCWHLGSKGCDSDGEEAWDMNHAAAENRCGQTGMDSPQQPRLMVSWAATTGHLDYYMSSSHC